jgi:hypothetical protein
MPYTPTYKTFYHTFRNIIILIVVYCSSKARQGNGACELSGFEKPDRKRMGALLNSKKFNEAELSIGHAIARLHKVQ